MDRALLLTVALMLGIALPSTGAVYQVPSDFMWGTSTAAYQVEGAYKTDGRGLSIWDVFSHTPNKTHNGDTGDIADDHYNRVPQDIALMQAMGVTHYRMSISWSRILPDGMHVNPLGVQHYQKEMKAMQTAGIKIAATMYHWDLPQALDGSLGGWLNSSITDAFVRYADVCFGEFGPYVSHWLTFNEPLTFAVVGYEGGTHAPGRCSDRTRCLHGNSSTEPYIVTHNVLRSHAYAVQLFRAKYQPKYASKIGIVLNSDWAEPLTDSLADYQAAYRRMMFQLAWFADPVFFGDYPYVMKQRVGARLPQFTDKEKNLLRGSADFFALNHYTSEYAMETTAPPPPGPPIYDTDAGVDTTRYQDGKAIGPMADSDWLWVVPWGMRKLLNWVYERYQMPIIITENGVDVPGESSMPLSQALNDTFRVNYLRDYTENVFLAMADGVKVHGYFCWSLMDNFEWADGYSKRFGLHYVDYNDNMKRYPKRSARFYAALIKQHTQSE